MDREIHPLVKQIIPLIAPLAETMGPWAEVVLHDFGDLSSSVVAIAGNITNRKIGAPITNIVLNSLKYDGKNNILNYKTELPDGRILRSSTIFFREDNHPVGCLCINLDITVASSYLSQLNTLVSFKETIDAEQFPNEVVEMTKTMIENVLESYQKPVAMMQKEDKLEIVKQLEAVGLFLVKGAMEEVSNSLHVSKYTIYNYLDEIRSRKLFNKE